MIHIALIDDEEKIRKIVSRYIVQTAKVYAEVKIYEFQSAEALLKCLRKKQHFDILFVDIELPEMSGVNLGEIVREKHPEIYLIFLTAHSEFAIEGYAIEAHQYILKNQIEKRLPKILKKTIAQIENEKYKFRIVGTTLDRQKIYYRDIFYIHKKKGEKYVQYITNTEALRERITIDQLLQELQSEEFLLAERGYIINMRHVMRIKGNTIYMENNSEIEVSKKRITEVKEKIVTYWRNR